MLCPLGTLHNPILVSQDPDANNFPSPEKATFITLSVWPLRVLILCLLETFYNPIVLPQDPEVKYSPENTTF